MRVTKRQLRRIINETWGSQQANAARQQGRHRTGRSERISPDEPNAMATYKQWVADEGHIASAASSVLATYVLNTSISHDIMTQLARELKVDVHDVRTEMSRQLRERGVREAKTTKRRLRSIIREMAISPDLEARVMEEMGDYGPRSLDEWEDGDYLEYLYEIQPEIEYENIPYKATVEYVKARFPEMAKEVDELFSEGGPRVFAPAFEAFEDLVDNEHPMAPANLLDGEEQSFRVSDIKREDGEEYRWWIWGNNLDPIDINIDATGTDRDGKTWTAEEMFQDIRRGKSSRFKVPKGRGYDLY